MGRIILTCLSLPLVSWLAFSGMCRAQENVMLVARSVVKVENSRVFLLDLFDRDRAPAELVEILSREVIGEMQEVGAVKYIYAEQLKSFMTQLLAHEGIDTARFPMELPKQIILERVPSPSAAPASSLGEEAVALCREHIIKKLGKAPEDVILDDVQWNLEGVVPAGERNSRVVAPEGEQYPGRVKLRVQYSSLGKHVGAVDVTATVGWYEPVVHAVRPLKKNAVLQVEDMELKRIPVLSPTQHRQASAMEDVMGKQLTRDVGASQPLSLDDLGDAVLIKRGSTVTIVYEVPGLKVTSKGQVKEDGGKGRIVKVVNVKSRRILDCRVIDAETVEAIP